MFNYKSFAKKAVTFTLAGTILFTPILSEAKLGDRVLVPGVNHADVKTLNNHLADLNLLDKNKVGTYYSNDTREAVKKLQKQNNLKADGIFGKASLNALNKSLNKGTTNVNNSNASNLSYNRLLKQGSKGNDVKALQNTLNSLGFNAGGADGIYGWNTVTAIRSFQSTYGLSADGMAGRNTINTINKVLSGSVSKKKPSTSTPSRGNTNSIITTAKKQLGKPYVFGSASGRSFDCSGFTYYVFKQHGINIPRTSTAQASVGKKVSRQNLQAGDLVIFSNTYKAGPSHVGIYLGNNKFIHASSGGKKVIVSSLNSSYYNRKFSYGRR